MQSISFLIHVYRVQWKHGACCRIQGGSKTFFLKVLITLQNLHRYVFFFPHPYSHTHQNTNNKKNRQLPSGVARAFRGGGGGGDLPTRRAKMRKEMRKVWGKIDKIDPNLRKEWGKWRSCPPGTVRLAMTLQLPYLLKRHFLFIFQTIKTIMCNSSFSITNLRKNKLNWSWRHFTFLSTAILQ